MPALRCILGICLPTLICISGLHPREPAKEPLPDLEQLLTQIAHPRFALREDACKRLIILGEPVLAAVRKRSAETTEYDVQLRCERVIRGILRNDPGSKSTGMKFTLVDSGNFTMGSPINEQNRRPDEAAHAVTITEPFVMGVYEVTQEEFEKVTGRKPGHFTGWLEKNGEGKYRVAEDTSRFPVENVTWFDAIDFCNELSRKDGYRPYYTITNIQRKEGAIVEAAVAIAGGNGYHLPTEAQWEHACRAGNGQPYHFGTRNRGNDANTRPGPAIGYGAGPDFTALNRTNKVGSYAPNHWALYDMSGNVGEWCWDWYDKDYYANSPVRNPPGPADGKHRVVRGGSWIVPEGSCRSASRMFYTPDTFNSSTGFRVIRQP